MMIGILAVLLQTGHVFQPADPTWKLIEDTLECRYTDGSHERKILRYDPQGRLRLEVDVSDGERFTRVLRSDGSLACYQHHRDSRLVDAFSVSADGRTVHIVQDGMGELVTEGEEGAWTHLLLLPGTAVAKDYRGDRCARISVWIGSDHYLRTPESEELSLYDSAEHWTTRGENVDLQITDLEIVDGKLRPRKAELNSDVQRDPPGAVWARRRAAFMARVDDALNGAEQDADRLNLRFILDGAAWPN